MQLKDTHIRPYRRTVQFLQAAVILGLPFLRINGESALRFDVPTLRLHVFGMSLWMSEFFIVLAALLFFTFFAILVTLVFGRVWCGWLCPQSVLADATGYMDSWFRKGIAAKTGSVAGVFLTSAVVAASLIWYFISPYEFIGRLAGGRLGTVLWGFWIVLTIIVFLDFLLLRRTFCATVCPYAKLQSVLFDRHTLTVAYDGSRDDECMGCEACVRVCPTGVDIRKGMDPACITCAECIDKCRDMKAKQGAAGLIGYFWGEPGGARHLLRRNVIFIGMITLSSLVFFLILAAGRKTLDMTVIAESDKPAVVTETGCVVRKYSVIVENRSSEPQALNLAAKSSARQLRVSPETFTAGPGEHLRLAADVETCGVYNKGDAFAFQFLLKTRGSEKPAVAAKATWFFPED